MLRALVFLFHRGLGAGDLAQPVPDHRDCQHTGADGVDDESHCDEPCGFSTGVAWDAEFQCDNQAYTDGSSCDGYPDVLDTDHHDSRHGCDQKVELDAGAGA